MRSIYPALLSVILIARIANAADQQDYLPLKKGSKWVANVKAQSALGSTLTGTAKSVLEEGVEQGGKSYLRERTTWDVEKIHNEYTKLTRKDETGVYSIIEGVKETTEQKEIPLPLKVGEAWTLTVNEKILQVTVLSIENVTIEGKVYKECFHIRKVLKGGGYTEDVWEAPVVGCVKTEAVYADGTKMTFTLSEFKSAE